MSVGREFIPIFIILADYRVPAASSVTRRQGGIHIIYSPMIICAEIPLEVTGSSIHYVFGILMNIMLHITRNCAEIK